MFSKTQLQDLLAVARHNNQRLGISGMLLYKDGDFIQLLEGEESVVRALLSKILADKRHHSSVVMIEESTTSRLFPDWSMGFRDLSDPDVQKMPGFSDFMSTARLPDHFAHDPNGCLDLLAMFKPSI